MWKGVAIRFMVFMLVIRFAVSELRVGVNLIAYHGVIDCRISCSKVFERHDVILVLRLMRVRDESIDERRRTQRWTHKARALTIPTRFPHHKQRWAYSSFLIN